MTIGLLVPPIIAPRITPIITLFSKGMETKPETDNPTIMNIVVSKLKLKALTVNNSPLGAPLNN